MKFAFAILCAGAMLTGCTSTDGVGRAMSYPATSTAVTYGGETYNVFEHKTDKTLMTTPTLGKSVAIGAAQTATLGTQNTATLSPQDKNAGAAQQYLNQTGRAACRVGGGKLILAPQYEFTYSCPTATAVKPAGGAVIGGPATGGGGGAVIGGGS